MKPFDRRVDVLGFRLNPLVVVGVTAALVIVYWMAANDPLIPDHIPGGKIDDLLLGIAAGFGLYKLLGKRR